MLQKNNPDIDFDALEKIVRRTATLRRHDPVASSRSPSVATNGLPPLNWRQRIRSWPYAGPLLARLYYRWRAMAAPGVDLRQRIRATPGIGEFGIWCNAMATLPSWRRQVQNELAHTQQQLAAVRSAQTELLREVAALRAAAARRDEDTQSPL